ncbi:MAG: type II toxin-antitoxin system RelE/ParE family toxin [Desulfarculus sp.]|nr:type II toxin-antitoxin system RelE/ParE family toxin [Desulfarculus sp.]
MIASFKGKPAEQIFQREVCRKLPTEIQPIAYRKLVQLHSAEELADLRKLPGNRLETLKGDRKGQHSIRINDQYRICFVWRGNSAHEVEIVDYHH